MTWLYMEGTFECVKVLLDKVAEVNFEISSIFVDDMFTMRTYMYVCIHVNYSNSSKKVIIGLIQHLYQVSSEGCSVIDMGDLT